jgi:deoxyinosine 3'endonuclease (endonuclease V)
MEHSIDTDKYNQLQLAIADECITKWDNREVNYIGGFDITYANTELGDYGKDVVSFVVIDKEMNLVGDKTIEYEEDESDPRIPYQSGYLAFREVPCFRKVWDLIKNDTTIPTPDVVVIDGNGLLHHRKCGSATHIGVEIGIPTIGVAKNLLMIDGFDKKKLKQEMYEKVTKEKIYEKELIGTSGYKYGYAWCNNNKGATNPIYISAGHMIDNEKSLEIIKSISQFREPEPVRLADRLSRQFIRDRKNKLIIS